MIAKHVLLAGGLIASAAAIGMAANDPSSGVPEPDFESACTATVSNFADACPCIEAAGREQGLNEGEMIAVLNGDEQSHSLAPAERGKFRRARYTCVIEAARERAERRMRTVSDKPRDPNTYTARPVRPQPLPADDYVGQAPTPTPE